MILKRGWFALKTVFKYSPLLSFFFVLLSLTSALFTPFQIFFTQRLVDSVTVYMKAQSTVVPLLMFGALLITSVFGVNLFNYLYNIFGLMIGRDLTKQLSPDILEKFRRLDYTCFEDTSLQDILKRMSSNPQLIIHNTFFSLISVTHSICTAAGIIFMFLNASPWLGIGAVCIAVPMYVLQYKSTHMQRDLWFNVTLEQRKTEYIQGLFTDKHSIYEIKVFHAVKHLMTVLDEIMQRIFKRYIRVTKKATWIFAASSLLMLTYIVFSIFSLSMSLAAGAVSLGIFISIIGSIGRFFDVMNDSSHVISSYITLTYDMRYYIEFLNLPERIEQNGSDMIEKPSITFENVCFTYPNTDREILHNLSFTILPNERVAFVGENGAGKSTIIKLLCGLYRPNSGRILIGVQDLGQLSDEQRQKLFSVVFQDFQSYQLTLRENIAFGDIRRFHDDAELIKALVEGGAGELLDKDVKGLDMNLGRLEDDGVDLSTGQWQRIATARAFLSDSAFVILDEPTASLDPIAESRMYEAFSRIFRNKGTIMISHRLASAKMADKIIVIDGGEAVEEGNHVELMTKGGLYMDMYNTQSSWYQDSTDGGEICA